MEFWLHFILYWGLGDLQCSVSCSRIPKYPWIVSLSTPWTAVYRSYGGSFLSLLRNLHLFSIVAVTNLHPPKYCRRLPFSPYRLRHLLLVVFLLMDILTVAVWYLLIDLIFSSLMWPMWSIFSCAQKNQHTQCIKLTSCDWLLEGLPCFELFVRYLPQDICWGQLSFTAPPASWIWSAASCPALRSAVSDPLQPHGP